MLRSLRAVDPGCSITVLCLSEICQRVLQRLAEPGVDLIGLSDFERSNPDVLAIKETRSLRDYYFTMSGCLVDWLLRDSAPEGTVTYVDADLLFYTSPAPLFAAMDGASVGLVGHRHHWWTRRLEKYGRFNVGWVCFRADKTGREAARWWRERCIEWCYGCVDGDRFADQKYLDHIFERFPNVVEIAHPGANIGPWNICRHAVARKADGSFVVDGKFPLIFVHYSGVEETRPDLYLCSNVSYLGPFSRTVRRGLYVPYIARLKQLGHEIGPLPADTTAEVRGNPPPLRRYLAPVIKVAGVLAGHYIDCTPRC